MANGSLGHERTMMWLMLADRIDNLMADCRPRTDVERDRFASTIIDYHALRAMGSAALRQYHARRNGHRIRFSAQAFGSEAEMRAADLALSSVGIDGLRHPVTERYEHMNPDEYFASRFERYTRGLAATIAGGTSEIQRNIIAQQVLGLPRAPKRD